MLTDILKQKRKELREAGAESRMETLRTELSSLAPTRSLKQSLTRGAGAALIAEIKRRSPSRGTLARNLDPARTARLYEESGASAVSVLTDSTFFSGSNEDLKAAKSSTGLPVLRKDFILTEFQVRESRVIGADAILLIAAALEPGDLRDLYSIARRMGLDVLVEVHSEADLREALRLEPEIVGINNRNLETFDVNLEVTERLRPLIPPDVVCVSESGIRTREDVVTMEALGVDGVLVGEEIVRSDDPGRRIQELLGRVE
jgi:indole-3-glycerol phosphate synthase